MLHALRSLSEVDLPCAALYLHRAEALLPSLCTRDEYAQVTHARAALPQMSQALREATARGEWSRVRALAEAAAGTQRRLAAAQPIVEVAAAVYEPRILRASATALALTGIGAQPTPALDRERRAVIDRLHLLAAADQPWRAFYASRALHFEHLEIVAAAEPAALADGAALQNRVLAAIERAEFAEVQRLTDALVAAGERVGRTRVPVPADDVARVLAAPVPAGAVDRARRLGLVPETLAASPSLNAYLGCCCADRATFPVEPLSETHRRPEACTCGHACPPDVRPTLRESLDLVLLHPFMTSAGTRYLPWFGAETLLLEAFPESDPSAQTSLLQALGLSRRCGLSRLAIEDALRTRETAVCEDLGLDPFEFTVACLPFDAYSRLAPQQGWGREQLWTHFDGYQVTRELHLRALVGGDVRYGGADDLCAVQRDYDARRILARFCVLRRQRFLVRHRPETDSAGGARQ